MKADFKAPPLLLGQGKKLKAVRYPKKRLSFFKRLKNFLQSGKVNFNEKTY